MTGRSLCRFGDETGQAGFATLGFFVLLVGIVGLATDLGAVLCIQQRLQGDADAAALAASTAIGPDWVSGTTDQPLSRRAAPELAREALEARQSDGELVNLELDGPLVTVELARSYEPPLLGVLGLGEVQLRAASSALLRSG